ncbi:short-chain dehydrogenase [Enterococcus florum]|uniref:Short-chain dehydrogenase n=1 Tax=Enterococcus florum TaxID=2480627 RepID=A0A4P5PBH4_9ENTE|nr:SDR family oxidoreductase [Enterococcus florum]GCF93641.1 short-chain dehydrogenase [Enterococcus florum]
MKTALVTGANSGMGFETARALYNQGFHVIMLCRSAAKGNFAKEQIEAEKASGKVSLVVIDLGSLTDIRRGAGEISRRYPSIDVLVNNAGVVTTKKEWTIDGFEKMFGVNYLGHFLLTQLLLPNLKRAEQGRIVVVSSGAYKFGKLVLTDLRSEQHFTIWGNYGGSKLANLLFAKEMSRRLKDTQITVNAVHPGAVATNLGVSRETGFGKAVYQVLKPFFQTSAQGAQTAIYLATSPQVSQITGCYFYQKRIKETTGKANDPWLATQLYEQSMQLIQ